MGNFQDIIAESSISNHLKTELSAFEDMCFKLYTLTERENEVLFGTMFASHPQAWQGKIRLLAEFEKKVNHICGLFECEKCFDTALLSYLYDRVERLECKIKVNASLHLHNYMQLCRKEGLGLEATVQCH